MKLEFCLECGMEVHPDDLINGVCLDCLQDDAGYSDDPDEDDEDL